MWSGLIPFVLSLYLWAAPAWAEDSLLGRVVAVDREAGRFSLLPMEGPERPLSGACDRAVVQPQDQGRQRERPEITVIFAHPVLPARLREGIIVRVWGKIEEDGGRFVAERITGMGCDDPTGVRARLGRGWGFGGGGGHRGGRHGR